MRCVPPASASRGVASVVLASVLLTACGGPVGPLAGGRLAGTMSAAPVRDWSFAAAYPLMEIEVRPADPYSVKIHYYLDDGRLYFEGAPSAWSRWRDLLQEDPRIRVRFGETVYPARAVAVTDPREIARVLPLYYAKDGDQPTAACAASWRVEDCAFTGELFRVESPATPE